MHSNGAVKSLLFYDKNDRLYGFADQLDQEIAKLVKKEYDGTYITLGKFKAEYATLTSKSATGAEIGKEGSEFVRKYAFSTEKPSDQEKPVIKLYCRYGFLPKTLDMCKN